VALVHLNFVSHSFILSILILIYHQTTAVA
jgi:hypothetical protein